MNLVMEQNDLVSIIIPVYNAEKYLQRCIDTLFAQTYKHIEYIFIDDGSTDGSFNILQEAALTDGRMTVVKKKNGGPSSARNIGLQKSNGKYIMFCDSDDSVENVWVEKLIMAAKAYPDMLVTSGFTRIIEDDSEEIKSVEYVLPEGIYSKKQYYELYEYGLTGSVCVKIYRKDIIEKYNIGFEEKTNHAEDAIFNLNYLEHMKAFYVLNELTYNYYKYKSNNSLSSNVKYKKLVYIYMKRLPYIAEEDLEKFKREFWWNTWNILKCNIVSHSWKEVKEIINNLTFQELLRLFGENDLDKVTFCLLKKRKFRTYLFWVKIIELKRKVL